MSEILRQALQEQYHASLAMLAECVEKCPDDLWLSGTHPRTFWRIAFHAVYFTHLYLGQNEEVYQPWPDRPGGSPELWQRPWSVEPYDLPEDFAPYTKPRMQDYIAYVDSLIDPTVDALDLDAPKTGIPWYRNMGKLSHELLNLRHVQGHVGQLSELLMLRGIDIDWISKAQQATPKNAPPPTAPNDSAPKAQAAAMQTKGAAAVFHVNDLERSLRFYRDTLGFSERFRIGAWYAGVEHGEVQIHLTTRNAETMAGKGHLYIFVDAVDSYYAQIVARGAKSLSEPNTYDYGMRDCEVADPDGNQLAFGMEAAAGA